MNRIIPIGIFLLCALWSGADTPQSKKLTLADPFILYHDGVYYAYGTGGKRGFAVYHSDSPDVWKRHTQLALNMEDSYGERGFWAPEVCFNPSDGRFYMFYTAQEHICVAVSDSPLGPFRQDRKAPMFDERAIDSSLFVDADGTPYLYFVRFDRGNVIWGAELEPDWMSVKPETLTRCITADLPWETDRGRIAEGPSVILKEGVYYLIYSASHFESQGYGVGFATSDAPLGAWTKDAGNPILCRPENGLLGTGHGSVFRDGGGRDWYVFHAHYDSENIHPRTLHLAPIEISGGRVAIDERRISTPVARQRD